MPDRNLVGMRIRNTENVQGISFRHRDRLKPDVVWGVLDKVVQSNARFGLTDRLELHLVHVRMPAGNGCKKTKGKSLDLMRAIVVVKAVFLCLDKALIIAMVRLNGDSKYAICKDVKCLRNLLKKNRILPVLIYVMAETFKNFGSFRSTFQTTKFLCLLA